MAGDCGGILPGLPKPDRLLRRRAGENDLSVLSRRDFLALATYVSASFKDPVRDRIALDSDTHGVTIRLNDEAQWRIRPASSGDVPGFEWRNLATAS
jgi:hypothetical protein